MSHRKRCTECRQRFEPSVAAKDRQLVCSASCRRSRRNRLARARRLGELEVARLDERERQARRRAAAASRSWAPCSAAGHDSCQGRSMAKCHGLASRRKALNSQREIQKIVARAASLSRASFEQGLQALAADLGWMGDWQRAEGGHGVGSVTDQPRRFKYR